MKKINVQSDSYMSKTDIRVFIGGETSPLSKATISLWIKTRNFPRPALHVSQRYPLWRRQDVIDWLNNQASKNEDETNTEDETNSGGDSK